MSVVTEETKKTSLLRGVTPGQGHGHAHFSIPNIQNAIRHILVFNKDLLSEKQADIEFQSGILELMAWMIALRPKRVSD